MRVYWDKWDKARNIGEEIEASSFDELERLIKRLDQAIYTQVVLDGKRSYLLIGGGKEQYVVTLVVGANKDFYTLVNPNKKEIENEIRIVTGGQAGLYPERIAVSYACVIEASRYYFEQFDKNPALFWINE